jgi:hypothetical protein
MLPQFPKPTYYIQQRYWLLYEVVARGGDQGTNSCTKVAALWTVFNMKGWEDFEYRLFHVYDDRIPTRSILRQFQRPTQDYTIREH